MAKADKKAGNLSAEGAVASYVHFNCKTGVLVEVNSETDFVAMNSIFKEFTSDLAMQIAGNPDNIKEKIVEGRLRKKFEENSLMGQKWLKDEDKTVQEVLKERIAKLGENLVVRRFVRINLGEGLDKEEVDFAAGVEKEMAKFRADA